MPPTHKLSQEDSDELSHLAKQDYDNHHPEQGNEDDDAPIIVYINKILRDAIRRGASDLHFEPYDGDYRIRFRIDGVLHEMASTLCAVHSPCSPHQGNV